MYLLPGIYYTHLYTVTEIIQTFSSNSNSHVLSDHEPLQQWWGGGWAEDTLHESLPYVHGT